MSRVCVVIGVGYVRCRELTLDHDADASGEH